MALIFPLKHKQTLIDFWRVTPVVLKIIYVLLLHNNMCMYLYLQLQIFNLATFISQDVWEKKPNNTISFYIGLMLIGNLFIPSLETLFLWIFIQIHINITRHLIFTVFVMDRSTPKFQAKYSEMLWKSNMNCVDQGYLHCFYT